MGILCVRLLRGEGSALRFSCLERSQCMGYHMHTWEKLHHSRRTQTHHIAYGFANSSSTSWCALHDHCDRCIWQLGHTSPRLMRHNQTRFQPTEGITFITYFDVVYLWCRTHRRVHHTFASRWMTPTTSITWLRVLCRYKAITKETRKLTMLLQNGWHRDVSRKNGAVLQLVCNPPCINTLITMTHWI